MSHLPRPFRVRLLALVAATLLPLLPAVNAADSRAEFLRLLDEATKSVQGEVTCTLCNDSYHSGCMVCAQPNNGKCAACKGTGRQADTHICPACSGQGRCFKCAGLGKMPCPFCDQRGTVHRNSPRPSPVPAFQ